MYYIFQMDSHRKTWLEAEKLANMIEGLMAYLEQVWAQKNKL